MTHIRYTGRARAGAADVWAVLADHAAMSGWLSRTWRSRLVRPGTTSTNGVGAIRSVLTLGGPVQEEVLTFDEPRHLGYRMVQGAPVIHDYRGDIVLSEDGDGTAIVWTFSFNASPRWLEPMVTWLVRAATKNCAVDLVRASERRLKQRPS